MPLNQTIYAKRKLLLHDREARICLKPHITITYSVFVNAHPKEAFFPQSHYTLQAVRLDRPSRAKYPEAVQPPKVGGWRDRFNDPTSKTPILCIQNYNLEHCEHEKTAAHTGVYPLA